jgi:hypothetical protein
MFVRIGVPRIVLLVALAPSLGGCFRDPYVATPTIVKSGSWQIERQPDRVTNAPITSALAYSMASNSAVAFPQRAQMQLLCFLDKPVVNFRFEFKIGTDTNSFLGYRFDDKPGHEIGGHFIANAASVAIEEPAEVFQFVGELAGSNVLYIRIRSLNAGRTTAEFKVDGAPAAIASAFATCPVKPPEPLPPPVARSKRGDRVSSR